MSKYVILHNPIAGNGTCAETAKKLASLFDDTAELADIRSINDYSTFFAENKENRIVICGGDGTLNHFINDTDGLELPSEVLFYASGSGNDFLHDIGGQEEGKPVDITKYLQNLPKVTVKGKTYRFLNGIGYGIDGYCCEVGDKLRETTDKPINYAGIAIKGLLFHFKPADAKVTVDGTTREFKKVWLAPAMNGRFYGGGMMPTPNQERLGTDRKLSVLVWHGSGKLSTLCTFPSIFKGEHIKKKNMCEVFTGKRISVEFTKPCALQIDGETILDVTSYEAVID